MKPVNPLPQAFAVETTVNQSAAVQSEAQLFCRYIEAEWRICASLNVIIGLDNGFRQAGAKSLWTPTLTYSKLDPEEQISMKFETIFASFLWRNSVENFLDGPMSYVC